MSNGLDTAFIYLGVRPDPAGVPFKRLRTTTKVGYAALWVATAVAVSGAIDILVTLR